MAGPTADAIRDLNTALAPSSSAQASASVEPFLAQVISVRRYFADNTAFAVIGDATTATELFDVVLSDGAYKTTFVLAPDFNSLAQQNILCELSLVRVERVSYHLDERSFASTATFVLRALEVLPDPPSMILYTSKSKFLRWAIPTSASAAWMPSIGCRKFYLEPVCDFAVHTDPRYQYDAAHPRGE
jgi:hypothetical protein